MYNLETNELRYLTSDMRVPVPIPQIFLVSLTLLIVNLSIALVFILLRFLGLLLLNILMIILLIRTWSRPVKS